MADRATPETCEVCGREPHRYSVVTRIWATTMPDATAEARQEAVKNLCGAGDKGDPRANVACLRLGYARERTARQAAETALSRLLERPSAQALAAAEARATAAEAKLRTAEEALVGLRRRRVAALLSLFEVWLQWAIEVKEEGLPESTAHDGGMSVLRLIGEGLEKLGLLAKPREDKDWLACTLLAQDFLETAAADFDKAADLLPGEQDAAALAALRSQEAPAAATPPAADQPEEET